MKIFFFNTECFGYHHCSQHVVHAAFHCYHTYSLLALEISSPQGAMITAYSCWLVLPLKSANVGTSISCEHSAYLAIRSSKVQLIWAMTLSVLKDSCSQIHTLRKKSLIYNCKAMYTAFWPDIQLHSKICCQHTSLALLMSCCPLVLLGRFSSAGHSSHVEIWLCMKQHMLHTHKY